MEAILFASRLKSIELLISSIEYGDYREHCQINKMTLM